MTETNLAIELTSIINSNNKRVGVPLVFESKQNPSTETVIPSQLPKFVIEEHEKFVKFIQAYYSFMENSDGVLAHSKKIKDYQDIDTTTEYFTEQFFKEYLNDIPRNILSNKSLLLKHIKQFYKSKGTENSYKFLFRILFNINVELYYPKVDILKISDGKWIQNKTIKIINTTGDAKSFVSKRIIGSQSKVTAYVEAANIIREEYIEGFELILNSSSITGAFLPNENIITEDELNSATVSGVISNIKLTAKNREATYVVDDIIKVEGNFPGKGGKIKVTKVDNNGYFLDGKIISYGLGYSDLNPPKNISGNIDILISGMTDYPGYYLNEDGHLSTGKYIHDGEFYQQFSYVTIAELSSNIYADILKKLIHPIGFKNFSQFRIQNKLVKKISGSIENKIQSSSKASINAKAYSNVVICHEIKHKNNIGSTNNSILRDKFNYKPFTKYDANLEFMDSNNQNYFGEDILNAKALTPVSVFAEIKPKELETNRFQKTNIGIDSVVITYNSDHADVFCIESGECFFDFGLIVDS